MRGAVSCVLALCLYHTSARVILDQSAESEVFNGDGCTSILVGPKATVEGGTMTTHTDDCMECDFRVSKVPAKDFAPGAMRPIYRYRSQYPRYIGYDRGETYFPENLDKDVYSWELGNGSFAPVGEIPQVEHTYEYFDGGYGIMNEWQLALGESTCGARITAASIDQGGKALLEMGELSRIAMERCKTARCAVETMGSLAETYGFHGADETPGESGESMQVADTEEAWVFHILPDDTGASAVWVAQRLPDDEVTVVANQFIIHKIDLSDKESFMASANVMDVAKRTGLWDPDTDGDFDFTNAYAMDRGHVHPYATRRVWRVFTLVAPSLELSPECSTFANEYPFGVKPDKLLTAQDIIEIHRDHYEGTEFDMTTGIAGGPYGDPSRFDPGDTTGLYADGQTMSSERAWGGFFERAISIYRCSYHWVSQSRPTVHRKLGLVWMGQYAPHASQPLPLYVGGLGVPHSMTVGNLQRFTLESGYWVHAVIGNWVDRFYKHAIGFVKEHQDMFDKEHTESRSEVEEAATKLLLDGKQHQARLLLTEHMSSSAERSLKSYQDLMFKLFAMFKDGQAITDLHQETVQPRKLWYPLWWLEQVGYYKGDPGLNQPTEEAALPPVTTEQTFPVTALFLSHVLVATVAVFATMAFARKSASVPAKQKLVQMPFQRRSGYEDIGEASRLTTSAADDASSYQSGPRGLRKITIQI